MHRTSACLLAAILLISTIAPITKGEDAKSFPAPAPSENPDASERGIQRTMTLLATSTPQHRNHVRILFYGQSITEHE